MPSTKRVHDLYVDSFRIIREFTSFESASDDANFTAALADIKNRHANVPLTMAEGLGDV